MYSPLGNNDTDLRMKALLAKILKAQESQKNYLMKIKIEISEESQKVVLYATTIKKLQ